MENNQLAVGSGDVLDQLTNLLRRLQYVEDHPSQLISNEIIQNITNITQGESGTVPFVWPAYWWCLYKFAIGGGSAGLDPSAYTDVGTDKGFAVPSVLGELALLDRSFRSSSTWLSFGIWARMWVKNITAGVVSGLRIYDMTQYVGHGASVYVNGTKVNVGIDPDGIPYYQFNLPPGKSSVDVFTRYDQDAHGATPFYRTSMLYRLGIVPDMPDPRGTKFVDPGSGVTGQSSGERHQQWGTTEIT